MIINIWCRKHKQSYRRRSPFLKMEKILKNRQVFTLTILLGLMMVSWTTGLSAETFPRSKSLLTSGNIRTERDSVVLSDLFEPELPYYSRIDIFRNGKNIYTFKDTLTDIDGSKDLFTEYRLPNSNDTYLIFRASGRPQTDCFLVLHRTPKAIDKIGFTRHSTADIFGDIDYDGQFEIGGFENGLEGSPTTEEAIKSIQQDYKVFEVKPGFPLDSVLIKALLPTVLKNSLENLQ